MQWQKSYILWIHNLNTKKTGRQKKLQKMKKNVIPTILCILLGNMSSKSYAQKHSLKNIIMLATSNINSLLDFLA